MKYIKVIGFKMNNLFLYFISCSFLGWCIETSYMFFTRGKLVSSGLLNCPFIPIYGFGGLLLIIVLKPLKHNIFLFFLGAIILTSLLEYLTGYLIKIFLNRIIWNYSGEFLSINGFICLKSSVFWGFLSLIFIYLIKPIMRSSISRIPKPVRTVITYSSALFFLIKAGNLLWIF